MMINQCSKIDHLVALCAAQEKINLYIFVGIVDTKRQQCLDTVRPVLFADVV